MYDAATMEEDEDPPVQTKAYIPETGPIVWGLALWVVIIWSTFHYII